MEEEQIMNDESKLKFMLKQYDLFQFYLEAQMRLETTHKIAVGAQAMACSSSLAVALSTYPNTWLMVLWGALSAFMLVITVRQVKRWKMDRDIFEARISRFNETFAENQ